MYSIPNHELALNNFRNSNVTEFYVCNSLSNRKNISCIGSTKQDKTTNF